jgi:DNA-binding XRE family transcriptional regulator
MWHQQPAGRRRRGRVHDTRSRGGVLAADGLQIPQTPARGGRQQRAAPLHVAAGTKLRAPVDFDQECFFITPIGSEGSPERARADATLQAIVEPSATAVGLTTIRADKIGDGGHITMQVLEHCTYARAAVADLTGGNLNVYYEVGIRHALTQPVVLIADELMRDALPFDLLQQRTVFYTDTMGGGTRARLDVTQQLERALAGNVDSPVQAAANLRGLQRGDAEQQTLAQLVSQVEELSTALARRIGPPSLLTPTGLRHVLDEVESLAAKHDDNEDLATVVSILKKEFGLAPAGNGAQHQFSPRLRALRDALGLSLRDLADRSGVSAPMLSQVERGETSPTLAVAARIARGLDMKLSDLLQLLEEDEAERPQGPPAPA